MDRPKFNSHIDRLKFKIREMEVKRLKTEALLKASEERLASQQHTIESNALFVRIPPGGTEQCTGGESGFKPRTRK